VSTRYQPLDDVCAKNHDAASSHNANDEFSQHNGTYGCHYRLFHALHGDSELAVRPCAVQGLQRRYRIVLLANQLAP